MISSSSFSSVAASLFAASSIGAVGSPATVRVADDGFKACCLFRPLLREGLLLTLVVVEFEEERELTGMFEL